MDYGGSGYKTVRGLVNSPKIVNSGSNILLSFQLFESDWARRAGADQWANFKETLSFYKFLDTNLGFLVCIPYI